MMSWPQYSCAHGTAPTPCPHCFQVPQRGEPLRWTTDWPTVPGWYWLREDGCRDGIAEVREDSTGLVAYSRFHDDGVELKIDAAWGFREQPQWAGPLPEPPDVRR